jgi:branched-subunit amino acid transport protein
VNSPTIMSTQTMLLAVAAMAVVTFLPRFVPLALFNKLIESTYIRSFLHYIPFAVLGSMVFPGILYSVPDIHSAIAGTIAAAILGFFNRGIMTVSVCAVIIVYAFGVLFV